MELYELLRHIKADNAIILFDLNGDELMSVPRKEKIPLDLYEETVVQLESGPGNDSSHMSSLYITLVK